MVIPFLPSFSQPSKQKADFLSPRRDQKLEFLQGLFLVEFHPRLISS